MRVWYVDRPESGEIEVASFPSPPGGRAPCIARMGRHWVTTEWEEKVRTVQFVVLLEYRRSRRRTTHVVGVQIREMSDGSVVFHDFFLLEHEEYLPSVAGALRWFMEQIGVLRDGEIVRLDTSRPLDEKSSKILRHVLAADPVEGRLLVSPEEVDIYKMLGELLPMFWRIDRLIELLREKPDTEWISLGSGVP